MVGLISGEKARSVGRERTENGRIKQPRVKKEHRGKRGDDWIYRRGAENGLRKKRVGESVQSWSVESSWEQQDEGVQQKPWSSVLGGSTPPHLRHLTVPAEE